MDVFVIVPPPVLTRPPSLVIRLRAISRTLPSPSAFRQSDITGNIPLKKASCASGSMSSPANNTPMELDQQSSFVYPRFATLNAPQIPTQYCFGCYPEPLEVVDINCVPDPSVTCPHQGSELAFFRKLREFDEVPLEGTLLAELFKNNQTPPVKVLADIHDIFFCYSWKHLLRSVPTVPPRPFNDTALAEPQLDFAGAPYACNEHATSMRLTDYYMKLDRHTIPSLLPGLVRYVCNVHGFTPSDGCYKDMSYRAPIPINWYPLYATSYYTNYRCRPYESLPVNPRIHSLDDMLAYEKMAHPEERATILAQSRLSISDVELNTRATDMANLINIFTSYPNNTDEDALGFFNDLKIMHRRYLDELTARKQHHTSFAVASWLFVRSRDCKTVLGLSDVQLPLSQQFALAYTILRGDHSAIIGNRIHAPLPPLASIMDTGVFAAISRVPPELRWGTKAEIVDAFPILEPVLIDPTLVCGLLAGNCTPEALWDSVYRRPTEPLSDVGFLLRLWCLARQA